MSSITFSRHTFLFPFRWDCCPNKFRQSIYKVPYKNRIDIRKFHNALNVLGDTWKFKPYNIGDEPNAHEKYNEYVFFYEHVRNAIYNTGNDIDDNKTAHCFVRKDLEGGHYDIHIQGAGHKNAPSYSLKIKEVSLRVYDTGVAILLFDLINEKYAHGHEILEINEFGRRIYPQFLGDFAASRPYNGINAPMNSFYAKKITIDKITPKVPLKTINRSFYENPDNFNVKQNQSPIEFSSFIYHVLGEKFKNRYDQGDGLKEGDILINPLIDDRMFAISSYANPYLCPTEEFYTQSDFWYKYLFVDGKGKTCQSKAMQEELLKRHSYIRWINYGSIYGVTDYSLVFLTKADNLAKDFPLIASTHMHTIYSQMVILALAQRASILRFSTEAALIAEPGKSEMKYEEIKELYKNHLRFVNKIYFREVTAQTQGIELYDMMQRHMRINEDIVILEKDIDKLHGYVELIVEKERKLAEEKRKLAEEKTNKWLYGLTVIGALFLIPTLLLGIMSINFPSNIPPDSLSGGYSLVWLKKVLLNLSLFRYSGPSLLLVLLTPFVILVYVNFKRIKKWLTQKRT